MNVNKSVLIEGYEFECTNFKCSDGTTTITVRVSGDGSGMHDLTGWVLEIMDDIQKEQINIVSCEKRVEQSAWAPAAVQKTTYELMGDFGFSGVLFEERIGRLKEDSAIEYRVTFDKEFKANSLNIAIIFGAIIFKSIEKMITSSPAHTLSTRLWATPIDKSFCLFLVVPGGYKPQGACKTNISITKRGLFMCPETTFDIENEELTKTEETVVTTKTNIKGCIKIIASIPLKSHQACGDEAYTTTCDCFEVDETIGYTNENNKFQMRDISICPLRQSFDLTLLNSHCGKSVYRLDGTYTIDCRRCK